MLIQKHNQNFVHSQLTNEVFRSHFASLKVTAGPYFACPACANPFNKPITYPCGRLICFDCLKFLSNIDSNVCPFCDSGFQIQVDQQLQSYHPIVQKMIEDKAHQHSGKQLKNQSEVQRRKIVNEIMYELMQDEEQNDQMHERKKQDCWVLIGEILVSIVAVGTLLWFKDEYY